MKILYTLNSSTAGGMEQHVLALVEGMVKLGHEVHVWCTGGDIGKWYSEAGAKVVDVVIKSDIDPVYIAALNSYLKDNQIDVIHANELKAVVNGLIAAKFAGTEVRISHTHTPISEWPAEGGLKKLFRKIEIKLYAFIVNKFATAEIALTQNRKQVKMFEGTSDSKLVVIPNCLVDSRFETAHEHRVEYSTEIRDKYNIEKNALVIGNVSRLSVEKRPDFLLRAYSRLRIADNVRSYLLLAGGGELEESLRQEIKTLNLEKSVVITDRFSQEDLPKFYAAIDVFVFPTSAEGFGLVLIEAMASGLPILSSDLPVLREVGGDTIDYFPTESLASLTKQLQSYVDFYASGKNIPVNEKAKNRALSLYTKDKFIQNHSDLYVKELK